MAYPRPERTAATGTSTGSPPGARRVTMKWATKKLAAMTATNPPIPGGVFPVVPSVTRTYAPTDRMTASAVRASWVVRAAWASDVRQPACISLLRSTSDRESESGWARSKATAAGPGGPAGSG